MSQKSIVQISNFFNTKNVVVAIRIKLKITKIIIKKQNELSEKMQLT
jgi:hypothetical protein